MYLQSHDAKQAVKHAHTVNAYIPVAQESKYPKNLPKRAQIRSNDAVVSLTICTYPNPELTISAKQIYTESANLYWNVLLSFTRVCSSSAPQHHHRVFPYCVSASIAVMTPHRSGHPQLTLC